MAEPVRRKKNIEDGGSGVHKRGEGLGTGPVGPSIGQNGKGPDNGNSGGGPKRGGGISPLSILVVLVILILSGGGGLSALLGDDGSSPDTQTEISADTLNSQSGTQNSGSSNNTEVSSSQTAQAGDDSGDSLGSILGSFLGGASGYYGDTSSEWSETPNTGKLNREVSELSRDKRTFIKGDGSDQTTIMVYLCGTDLESKNGMGTKDLQEMMSADLSENINLIVYTGGCKEWQNNFISNSTNQIFQIKNGKAEKISDQGNKCMTDPDTLSGFIKWTADKYPADRYDLIFWDHGGGSVSGYGYDEKNALKGSMGLSGIDKALKDSGVTFDFVGFDACLMATVETALVVSKYSDYMIASEETEPGIGWYYTDWLNAYSKAPSMDTLSVGQLIIDTYTSECQKYCRGQKTTLSLIDLAELENTVPLELKEFANSTSELITKKEYQTVSNARSRAREFAASSKIDQVDLIHLSSCMGTDEGKKLSDALKSSVKYNRTSDNMTNAYGLSIYFPYKKAKNVDSMAITYEEIGIDESYTECIKQFASMQVAGQMAAGGTQSPAGSLFGDSESGSIIGADALFQLFESMMSSGITGISGLDSSNTEFFGKGIDLEAAAEYISEHRIDSNNLKWTANDEGEDVLILPENQKKLIQSMDVNIFYDDGTGYINLGLDNSYDIDEDKNPIAPSDRTWLAIDGQIVSYQRIDTQGDADNYSIMGKVPCMINDDRADLILIFDSENEDGYVAGANYDYEENETETVAKNLTELHEGDRIDFITDFYDYDKNYQDTYYIGETMTIDKDMSELHISNMDVGDGDCLVTFKITDIYGQDYWTPALTY